MSSEPTIRVATLARDAHAVGRMGAALVAQHHAYDGTRFMLPPGVEESYQSLLEPGESPKLTLVAELGGKVVGYAYGRMDPLDWSTLRGPHGGFHDLWVEPEARRSGVGRLLAEAMLAWFREQGATTVILSIATKNAQAQAFAAAMGWQPTMVEMTLPIPERPR